MHRPLYSVYSAVRPRDGTPLVIKTRNAEYPSRQLAAEPRHSVEQDVGQHSRPPLAMDPQPLHQPMLLQVRSVCDETPLSSLARRGTPAFADEMELPLNPAILARCNSAA